MKVFLKGIVCVALLAAICLFPITGKMLAVKAKAAAPEATAAETVTPQPKNSLPHSMNEGRHLMEWGVFLFGAGEVGALIGMGICNIRREKRRELQNQQRRIANDANALLLYSEYKASLGAPAANGIAA